MYLTVGAHRLEYRMVGPASANGASGSVLVLLHEGLGSVSMWKDFPERLTQATGHPVLAYSRHGHGRSSELLEPRRFDYMHHEALVVLPTLLHELGVRQPVLIGHSDGASIAIIHAGSGHPVSGLVLMAPHVFVENLTLESIAAARHTYETTALEQKLARYHDHPRTMFYGWNDIWLKPEFRKWNIEASVDTIEAPMLLLQSEHDPYGTLAQIDAIEKRATRRVMKLLLANCGHSPHVDQPNETIRAIIDFVGTLDKKGSTQKT